MDTRSKNKMVVPSYVSVLMDALQNAGYEAYLVGGCVRDFLLEKEIHDYDMTTSATPDQMKSIFAGWKQITDGEKHGTIAVVSEGHVIEITTYRVDSDYYDHRHPSTVSFSKHLKDDLARRDFTMNAMAYHPNVGIVDMFSGKKDLVKRCIRCVGDPKKRFDEDALRMMRCLRFSSEIGFTIDEKTEHAMLSLSSNVAYVSRERVFSELNRLLMGKNVEIVLQKHGVVLSQAIPEMRFISEEEWHRIGMEVQSIPNVVFLRWVPLVWRFPVEQRTTFMKKMTFPSKWIKKIQLFGNIEQVNEPKNEKEMRWLFYQYGRETVVDFLDCFLSMNQIRYETSYEIAKSIPQDAVFQISQLNITGKDFLEENIVRGTGVGVLLEKLLFEVVFDSLKNQRIVLLKRAKEISMTSKNN